MLKKSFATSISASARLKSLSCGLWMVLGCMMGEIFFAFLDFEIEL
jgi:hypothetical protein